MSTAMHCWDKFAGFKAGHRGNVTDRSPLRAALEFLEILLASLVVAGCTVGLTTNAQAKACEQEYKTVQAGLDAYMANNNVDTVAATTAAGTSDMTAPILLYNATPSASSPTYLRNTPTQWAYVWNTTGRITAIQQAGSGPSVPSGCGVSGG